MRKLFDVITRLALRLRWVTVTVTLALIGLGVVAYGQLNQELIPNIDFPQTIILAQNSGASSDQILHMYSAPLEDSTAQINGVVNIESTSQQGLALLIVRNEFGLDQDRIQADVVQAVRDLALPVRVLVPAEGTTPQTVIGELSPEAVIWLHDYAQRQDVAFTTQLSPAVWHSFSPQALGALPDSIFANLPRNLREELLVTRQPVEVTLPAQPPDLPASWQEAAPDIDRFQTVEDIAELAQNRTLADIFNTFVEDGRVAGPLGTTDDLTLADLQVLLDIQARCQAFRDENSVPLLAGDDPCSFVSQLPAEVVLALPPDIRAALPADYQQTLDFEARNTLAAAYVAGELTGQVQTYQAVPLPDAWQANAPLLLSFNLSDLPLGFITVSSDQLSRAELEDVVRNTLVPRIQDLNQVATVTVVGGGQIELAGSNSNADTPADEGSATPAPDESTDETASDDNEAPASDDQPPADGEAQPGDETPPLPDIWREQVAGFLDAELNTAADLLTIGQQVDGVDSAAAFLNMMAGNPAASSALAALSPEVLLYLGQNEADFFANLSSDVLDALSDETVAALPIDDAGEGATTSPASVELGEYWAQLSAQPALQDQPLATTADLAAFDGDPARTLADIVRALEEGGYPEFAILLIDSLSPQAVEALLAADEDFLASLAETEGGQRALTYFAPEVLNLPTVATFIDDELSGDLQTTLQAIRSGEQSPARAAIETGPQVELLDDPDAPALPPAWQPVGDFIGSPLENADDIINTRALPAYASGADFINQLALDERGQPRVRELSAEAWVYLGQNEDGFWQTLNAVAMRLIPEDVVANLPPDVQNRLAGSRTDFTPPSAPITRTNQESSLMLIVYKTDDANSVATWHQVQDILDDTPQGVNVNVPFEQASFIEESITGVRNEGTLGAIMAVIVILLFMNLSLRSTLVTSVSIPASVMIALVMMQFVPSTVYGWLAPVLDDVGRESTLGGLLEIVLRLFPETYTLNIMTLSGLTVAIGRVVDDSIVVLENIYRNVMHGEEKHSAILNGTREVSLAIFAATLTTMVVFLPLGLFGGVVGAFFLPFGLAVTYALAASFVVAITTIPALAYFFISKETMPDEGLIPITDKMGGYERRLSRVKNVLIRATDGLSNGYSHLIEWVLGHRLVTLGVAVASLVFGLALMAQLPQTFLPPFGDPSITVAVNLPAEAPDGTPITILQTEEKVSQLEAYLMEQEGVETVQTIIGGDFNSFDPSVDPNTVTETRANIQVGMRSQADLDALLDDLRAFSESLFNDLDGDGQPDVQAVRVSGAQEQGDFGGFSLVVSGPEGITLEELAAYNEAVLAELAEINGLVNVESSLGGLGGNGNGTTYIRINSVPAIRYTGELETQDTLGVTDQALLAVQSTVDELRAERDDLTTSVTVTKGFESEQQEEGFQQLFVSMGIATLIVYVLLALTFNHLVHPATILVSLPLAVVGAAVALAVTGRVLGLSAMIGLLMLIGIVVTNAVVLLDRVQQNRREKGMSTHDALVEAGQVRLRPILMTAVSTTMGVLPLALGFTEGALIAAELGTVVIGGLVSSTLLTLLVVPVVYSVFDTAQQKLFGLIGLKSQDQTAQP